MSRLSMAMADLAGEEGSKDAFTIFSCLGHSDFEYENVESFEVGNQKTTSLRLPEFKIDALDSVASYLQISRKDAMSLAINDFIASALVGYAIGKCQAIEGHSLPDENHVSSVLFKIIDSLELSEESKNYVSTIAKDKFLTQMGIV